MSSTRNNYSEITKRLDEITDRLDAITTRLDLTVSLLLDILLINENFKEPGQLVDKLKLLDSSRRFQLRPADAGRILGRPSRDISSRRKEIAQAKGKSHSSRRMSTQRDTGTKQTD